MRRTRTSPGRTVALQVAELRDAPALLVLTLTLALTRTLALSLTRWLSCETLLLCMPVDLSQLSEREAKALSHTAA